MVPPLQKQNFLPGWGVQTCALQIRPAVRCHNSCSTGTPSMPFVSFDPFPRTVPCCLMPLIRNSFWWTTKPA